MQDISYAKSSGKLGWKPLLFEDSQIQRWVRIFGLLKRDFYESDFPTTPPK
jgi:hypothetical protein